MSNITFQFKQFTIQQDRCAMKVTTDGCLFGAWVADYLRVHPVEGNALDIGAGTGLLSLMIAQKTTLKMDAVEIDPLAAGQAFQNILGSPFSDRIKVVQADISEAGEHLNNQYNFIVSNPPFYENSLVSPNNRKNSAHHHHSLKLDTLLSVIQQRLAPDGDFFLMLPAARWEELKSRVAEYGLAISTVMFVNQTPKHSFFRVLVRGRHRSTIIEEHHQEEMTIKGEDGNYTEQFVFLLKEYYLYL